MASKKSKHSKKSKRKFKKIVFKLSYKEYEYLQKCLLLEKTTANKLIKKYLREGFEELKPRVTEWEKQKQPENQLLLFDYKKQDKQSSLLEEDDFIYPEKD